VNLVDLVRAHLPGARIATEETAAELRAFLVANRLGPPAGQRVLAWQGSTHHAGFAVCDEAFLFASGKNGNLRPFDRFERCERVGGSVRIHGSKFLWVLTPPDVEAVVAFFQAFAARGPLEPTPEAATPVFDAAVATTEADLARIARIRRSWVHGREQGPDGFYSVLEPGELVPWLGQIGKGPPKVSSKDGRTVVDVVEGSAARVVASHVVAAGMAKAMASVVGFGVGVGPRVKYVHLRFRLTPRDGGGVWIEAVRIGTGIRALTPEVAKADPWMRAKLHDTELAALRGEVTRIEVATPVPVPPPPPPVPRPPPAPREPSDGLRFLPAGAHAVSALIGLVAPVFVFSSFAGAVVVGAAAVGDPKHANVVERGIMQGLVLGMLLAPLLFWLLPAVDVVLVVVHLARNRESRRLGPRAVGVARALSALWAVICTASILGGNLVGWMGGAAIGFALIATRARAV
jgi:hypothetical protein